MFEWLKENGTFAWKGFLFRCYTIDHKVDWIEFYWSITVLDWHSKRIVGKWWSFFQNHLSETFRKLIGSKLSRSRTTCSLRELECCNFTWNFCGLEIYKESFIKTQAWHFSPLIHEEPSSRRLWLNWNYLHFRYESTEIKLQFQIILFQ